MGKLIYSMIMSVEDYVENEHGGLDWAPDEEVNFHINQLVSSVGTYLYGRRMYESMVYWETSKRGPLRHPRSSEDRRRLC